MLTEDLLHERFGPLFGSFDVHDSCVASVYGYQSQSWVGKEDS